MRCGRGPLAKNNMDEATYYTHLYEVARQLNQEFSLPSALRRALEKTVELLQLETGWIWLVQSDQRSVYLAASHHLPPALSEHPERLSGWCYCIDQYLAHDMAQASNVSEITCSRLKKIKSGTRDLKFHATVPITAQGQKIGLLNLVSRESQRLDEPQLTWLNATGELIGTMVQRTRTQSPSSTGGTDTLRDVLNRLLVPRVHALTERLERQADDEALRQAQELQDTLTTILDEGTRPVPASPASLFSYPTSPLTDRELEVLALVKDGHTNRQIAEKLFVAERTIKFHMSSILSKLYARTRTEAVRTAVQRGLIIL